MKVLIYGVALALSFSIAPVIAQSEADEINQALVESILSNRRRSTEGLDFVDGISDIRKTCSEGAAGNISYSGNESEPAYLNQAEVGYLCISTLREDVANGNIFSMQEALIPEALKGLEGFDATSLAIALHDAAERREIEYSYEIIRNGVFVEERVINVLPGRVFDSAYATSKSGFAYDPVIQGLADIFHREDISAEQKGNLRADLRGHSILIAGICYSNLILNGDINHCNNGGQLMALLEE